MPDKNLHYPAYLFALKLENYGNKYINSIGV